MSMVNFVACKMFAHLRQEHSAGRYAVGPVPLGTYDVTVTPAGMAASTQRSRKSRSVRVASSADHSTSPHRLRARETDLVTISRTVSGSICSFAFMCSGLVEMKVWMRGRLA